VAKLLFEEKNEEAPPEVGMRPVPVGAAPASRVLSLVKVDIPNDVPANRNQLGQ
jgi:hypothetical protein